MKNKVLCIFISLILFVLSNYGQEPKAVFPDGTTVIFENKIASKLTENSDLKVKAINVLSFLGGTNTVHRFFIDRENKSHFGYDLVVKKDDEKGKYTVAFKPLSMMLSANGLEVKNLTKFPEPMQLNEGDTISVELLENPKTKEKIADLIKIIQVESNQKNHQPNQIIIPDFSSSKVIQTTQLFTRVFEPDPSAKPKDFTLDEIKMQITNANLLVNGKQIAEKKTALAGNVYFYLKGKGRFILSPVPREGYKFQKTGVIDTNKISFEFNGDKYEIKSFMPIMYYGGKWNLWVLYEPDYRPNSDVEEEFGSGSMQILHKAKGKK
jgi:hypothetical protein